VKSRTHARINWWIWENKQKIDKNKAPASENSETTENERKAQIYPKTLRITRKRKENVEIYPKTQGERRDLPENAQICPKYYSSIPVFNSVPVYSSVPDYNSVLPCNSVPFYTSIPDCNSVLHCNSVPDCKSIWAYYTTHCKSTSVHSIAHHLQHWTVRNKNNILHSQSVWSRILENPRTLFESRYFLQQLDIIRKLRLSQKI